MSGDAAMQAALGNPAPPAQGQRLSWVEVDSPPRMTAVLNPVDGSLLGQYAEVDDDLGMTDAMATKFREVCDGVDFFECEANVCVDSPYQRRGKPAGKAIGWVLAGEADERTEWRAVALVQQGATVIAVCEGCSPSTIYARLWEA